MVVVRVHASHLAFLMCVGSAAAVAAAFFDVIDVTASGEHPCTHAENEPVMAVATGKSIDQKEHTAKRNHCADVAAKRHDVDGCFF